jgi:hypothetical protein
MSTIKGFFKLFVVVHLSFDQERMESCLAGFNETLTCIYRGQNLPAAATYLIEVKQLGAC